MDGKVLLEAVEALVKIKKVDRNMVFDALEMVLLTAYKKESGSNAKASVSLNRETGEYKIYEEKTVVDEIHEDSENAINEITVEEAKKIDRSYEAGDMLRIDVTPKNFGRVAAQAAKQVMIQKLREAERGSIYDEFSGREGAVITGVVKWNESRTIFVDLGRVEGILPFAEQIEGEEFQPNDKIKCYVLEVRKTTKGPEIILSRTHPGLLNFSSWKYRKFTAAPWRSRVSSVKRVPAPRSPYMRWIRLSIRSARASGRRDSVCRIS